MSDYEVEMWLVYECADCRFRWPVQLEFDGSEWTTGDRVEACPRCGSKEITEVTPTDDEIGAM